MELIEIWWLSLAIFAVVTLVVSVLLGLIISAAQNIDRHASEIWTVGKQIAGNTVSIWMLEKTNELVMRMGDTAASIERRAASIDEKVGLLGRRG
jgi:hypothetical protein